MSKGEGIMIDFDFTYLQPKTIEEAYMTYQSHVNNGNVVMYFNGGTEFISRARHHEIDADIVIDIKHIPECQTYKLEDGKLYIGASVSLSMVSDQMFFPLLSRVARGIATRTARNKITVGGNLCSHLPYKEISLPFLLADSTMVIVTEQGVVKRPMTEFDQLKDDEFLVQIITEEEMTLQPFTYKKRTRQSHINYPIVTLASMEHNDQLSVAVSGLCDVPIYLHNVHDDTGLDISETIIDDELATKEYRKFVYQTLLHQVLNGKEKDV